MDLSIITVSYNTKSLLKDTLRSIYKHTKDVSFEVIVVDNASTDGSPEMVKKDFKKTVLIKSDANLGFGKANNLGAKKAKGKYLLFLNSDTLVNKSTLKESLEKAQNIKNLGVFSCQLRFADNTIQPTGGYFPNLLKVYTWQSGLDDLPLLSSLLKPIHLSKRFFKTDFAPDWLTGAFMLIPTKTFKQVGGFDPQIFMYSEDIDLCYRLKKMGKTIHYSSSPHLIHLQSKSSSSVYSLTQEVVGTLYFFKKHFPSWQLPLVRFAFMAGSLWRWALFGIIMGNEQKRQAYWKILIGKI